MVLQRLGAEKGPRGTTVVTLFLVWDFLNREDPGITGGWGCLGWWVSQCKPIGKPVGPSVLICQTSLSTPDVV